MTPKSKSFWTALLRGAAQVLFMIAGLTFLVGGKVISDFANMDRLLGEMLGLIIAVLTGGLGYLLKTLKTWMTEMRPILDVRPNRTSTVIFELIGDPRR